MPVNMVNVVVTPFSSGEVSVQHLNTVLTLSHLAEEYEPGHGRSF